MARLGFSEGKWSPNLWGRFLTAVRKGLETYDFDSGWVPTPAGGVVAHGQGVLPKTVLVYASDNADGTGFSTDSVTSVDAVNVTFSGPKAYCRVLVNT